MNRITILKILEYTWLSVGIISMLVAAYTLNAGDKQQAMLFLVFTLVSGILFMLRRQQRKWAEKSEN